MVEGGQTIKLYTRAEYAPVKILTNKIIDDDIFEIFK